LGLIVLLFLIAGATFGPLLWRIPPDEINLLNQMAPISLEHPLGTDENGRDVLARLMHGARVSLAIGLSAAGIAIGLGTLVGLVAGYAGKAVDNILMRVTDALMSIPTFFLLLAVVSFLGASIFNVVLALGITRWMGVARLVRGETLKAKEMEFVLAAHALGARPHRIVLRHLLPQAIPSISVATTLSIATAILVESALSYLGLGVQPPTPTWGNMLSYSQNYIWVAPHLAIFPGVLILITILAFNFVGDGLRDALDPYRARS
jgi:peptide/nickel transport system permease protein